MNCCTPAVTTSSEADCPTVDAGRSGSDSRLTYLRHHTHWCILWQFYSHCSQSKLPSPCHLISTLINAVQVGQSEGDPACEPGFPAVLCAASATLQHTAQHYSARVTPWKPQSALPSQHCGPRGPLGRFMRSAAAFSCTLVGPRQPVGTNTKEEANQPASCST